MKTKKKFRFWIIMRNILLTIVAGLLILFVLHNILTAHEQKIYPAIGQLVEVDGKNMHVYTKGDGENTIVLLGGMGTAAPVLDFEPLINEMSKNNKVVVVELFGYGWSDLTNKERTVENIVEEIRTALKESNNEGPYILMPHSISGFYSLYYANKYPDEVRAVIGIDPTVPKVSDSHKKDSDSHAIANFISYIAPTGIARLVNYLIPDSAEEGAYSEENLKMTNAIAAWKVYNKNVVNEINETSHNIYKTIDMTFPSDIPVMIFTPKKENMTEDDKSKIKYYRKQLSNRASNKLVTLGEDHYPYITHYKEMSEYVNEFMKTNARD